MVRSAASWRNRVFMTVPAHCGEPLYVVKHGGKTVCESYAITSHLAFDLEFD